MFGYVEVDKPELKMREYEIFRGYYCSLCKTLGRRYGQVARFTLTYDLTFLYVLLDAINSLPLGGKNQRCIAHPLKKHFVIKSNLFAEYTSDMNIILMYYSLMDKWKDEKKLLGGTGTIALSRAFKKAKKKNLKKAENIGDHLQALAVLENHECSSVDETADKFGSIMQELFQCEYVQDEGVMKALGWMGYNMGRWIYILDAYDDIEEDYKKDSYNPLIRQYNFDGVQVEAFKEAINEKVDFSLTYSLSEIEKAYSLLEIRKNKGILDNILYSGLIVKTDKVLQERGNVNEKGSV